MLCSCMLLPHMPEVNVSYCHHDNCHHDNCHHDNRNNHDIVYRKCTDYDSVKYFLPSICPFFTNYTITSMMGFCPFVKGWHKMMQGTYQVSNHMKVKKSDDKGTVKTAHT